jgi:uncharacterized membrane protein YphA (DoxX/SURF4 family)
LRRTYYPGFLGALFLVLLRIAIGWHFLYEGAEKVRSRYEGGKPFSAEPYLRHATGPLAPYFRGLVPDVNSLAKLDPARLKASWTEDVARKARHYGFDQKQRDEADAVLKKSLSDAEIWFQDKEFQEKQSKYHHELAEVEAVERSPEALASERERAAAQRKNLDADRKELTKDLDAVGGALREAVAKIATPEQRNAAGPYVDPWTTLDWINYATAYGLVVTGLCLMAGLFTLPAALAAAVFLGQIYLSMPPWPWLPASPAAEGHYLFVNQNVVEMLACLVLACLPTGQWVGLDALVFGEIRRHREQRELEREAAELEHGSRK